MLIKIKRHKVFIPCGFTSLAILPLLLLYYVESSSVASIELNILPKDYATTTLLPNRSIAQIDNLSTNNQLIDFIRNVKNSNDTSIVYQIRFPKINRYKELIAVLDELQKNKISFYVSDNLFIAWLGNPKSHYYQLSHYIDTVREPSPLENDVITMPLTPWDELRLKPWENINLLQTLLIIGIGWLFLFDVSIDNVIQVTKNRHFANRFIRPKKKYINR